MATTTGPGDCATTMQKEVRKQKWALFLFGNLVTIGSVIYELESLNLCFVEGETYRNSFGSEQVGHSRDVENFVVGALWLGVVYEMLSALVLSTIYSSPLDAKSAHKVPPNDNRGHCARLFLRFLTPCIWGVLLILIGYASIRFATFRSCDTNGGTWLIDYLLVSGNGMLLLGFIFLIFFMAIFLPIFACCCECVRNLSNKLLKTFPYIELFWQLQNVVFGYRSGAFNVYVAVAWHRGGDRSGVQ